jgi:glycosyltransferase involved in cell wall biosynthesis
VKRTEVSTGKVALFTNIIPPYRIPCFNRAAETAQFGLDVFFFARTARDRQWKVYEERINFRHKILKAIPVYLGEEQTLYLSYDVFFHLVQGRYDAIVLGGYEQPLFFPILLFCKLANINAVLWVESTSRDERSGSWPYEKLKRLMVRNCSAFLVPGTASFEYVRALGAPADRIFTVPNAVDDDHYHKEFLRLVGAKERIKSERGYPATIFLFSGRFIRRKGIQHLLAAFRKLQREKGDVGLVLLGDGRERRQSEDYCKSHGIKNVFFEGFINQEDLPKYYTAGDIFVLPSLTDQWGLVINEAMTFGLPIISTDVVGAAHDLVKHGVNGLVVKPGNSIELYRAMKQLLDHPQLRRKMGKESLNIIRDYTPEAWAENFVFAIERTLGYS